MRTLMALLLAGIMASVAVAGLDPATDSFGVCFDAAGNTNCTTAAPFQAVTAYLLLMNPAGPTNGFECTVTMVGAPYYLLASNIACGWDFPDNEPPYDYAAGCVFDYPVLEGGAIVLVTWSIMLREPSELLFHVGPARVPSLPGGLPVVAGEGVRRLCGVASGDVNLPVAAINAGAGCPVSAQASSFGTVKSLFR
jgi:hypothetical protein